MNRTGVSQRRLKEDKQRNTYLFQQLNDSFHLGNAAEYLSFVTVDLASWPQLDFKTTLLF